MFERGGTALTPTETKILGSAFILHGKTDERILADIDLADKIVEARARLSLGGSNAAMNPNENIDTEVGNNSDLNFEQERKEAIEKIQSGKYDAKKVAAIFKSITHRDLNEQQ